MFKIFLPSPDDLLNWWFVLKVLGSVAGILFLAYALLDHVVEPYLAYRLTRATRIQDEWRDQHPRWQRRAS